MMSIMFRYVCSAFGLTASGNKTEKVCIPIPHAHAHKMYIKPAGQNYEQTNSFVYLGGSVAETSNRRSGRNHPKKGFYILVVYKIVVTINSNRVWINRVRLSILLVAS